MARKVVIEEDEEDSDGGGAVNESQPQTQSRELFGNFMREEFQLHGLDIPANVPLLAINAARFSNPLWTCSASSLRRLAEAFSRSPARELVRQRARMVDLTTLSRQNFWEMIQEVFNGGQMTCERILVVFFFCFDVATHALQSQAMDIFRRLIQWSTEYITSGLTTWIQEQGGWAAVLNGTVNTMLKISATVACLAVVSALFIYIRKNLN